MRIWHPGKLTVIHNISSSKEQKLILWVFWKQALQQEPNLSLNPLYLRTVAKHLLWPKLWSFGTCQALHICVLHIHHSGSAWSSYHEAEHEMGQFCVFFFSWKLHTGKRKKSITFPELSILLSQLTYKTKRLNYSCWINQNTWCQWCADSGCF